jgi:hypothetical protein
MYIYVYLNGKNGSIEFKKYYYGKFDKSFLAVSNIIARKKFVVDLSLVKNDGGGTQYTYLEAIHNDCALILHRSGYKIGTTIQNTVILRKGIIVLQLIMKRNWQN